MLVRVWLVKMSSNALEIIDKIRLLETFVHDKEKKLQTVYESSDALTKELKSHEASLKSLTESLSKEIQMVHETSTDTLVQVSTRGR